MTRRAPWGSVLLCLALALGLQACGPKSMEARMKDAERYADKASSDLDKAEAAAQALEPKDLEKALADAKEWLAQKDIELYPEAQMHLDRYKELSARLPAVKAEREKRDLEKRLNAARDRIVPLVQGLLEAQEALSPTAPTKAQVDAIEDKARRLREAVDDQLDLFTKDSDFAQWAKNQRSKVDKGLEAAARGRKGLAVMDGPGAAWLDAQAKTKEAKGEKRPKEKQALLNAARGRLVDCRTQSGPLVKEELAVVIGSGKPQTAKQLLDACEEALKPLDKDLKKTRDAVVKLEKAEKARADKEAKAAKAKAAAEAKKNKKKK